MRLSVTAAPASDGRLLSSFFIPHNVDVYFYCCIAWWCLYCCIACEPTAAIMLLNLHLICSQHSVHPDDDGKLMGFDLIR